MRDGTLPESLVDHDTTANWFGKPPSWLYANAGPLGIPRYRIGRHWRYKLSEVAAWVERQGR